MRANNRTYIVHHLATALAWPLKRDDPELNQFRKADMVVVMTGGGAPLMIDECSAIAKLTPWSASRGHGDHNCRC